MYQEDEYIDFSNLAKKEIEGRDFKILVNEQDSPIVIMAIHGGGIEPGTSEIAKAIAGGHMSLYRFEGIKSGGNEVLHITSTHFDEPKCLNLAKQSDIVVTIHGCDDKSEQVNIGGLHGDFIDQIFETVNESKICAVKDESNHSGKYTSNICNKGRLHKGVQLELSEGLRHKMFDSLKKRGRRHTKPLFGEFVSSVRKVLLTLDK